MRASQLSMLTDRVGGTLCVIGREPRSAFLSGARGALMEVLSPFELFLYR